MTSKEDGQSANKEKDREGCNAHAARTFPGHKNHMFEITSAFHQTLPNGQVLGEATI